MCVARWDVYQLPLRDGCVDHIVTDLPFGKKIGNKERNLFLYPIALGEMARVCRAQGKAVLLTPHKSAMKKALDRQWNWWRMLECRMIFMGGMKVFVYILVRTGDVYMKKEHAVKHTKLASKEPERTNKTKEKEDCDVKKKKQESEDALVKAEELPS